MYIGEAIRFPGEIHLFGHNFTSPGTRTNLRVNRITGQPHEWSKPVNAIDATALNHDLAYELYGDSKYGQYVADRLMVSELDNIPYSSLSTSEKIQKFLVRNAINAKQKLGLGINETTEQEA